MTREDIIRMAQECQLIGIHPHIDGIYQAQLEQFATLVASHEQKKLEEQSIVDIHKAVLEEREACAKLCLEFGQVKNHIGDKWPDICADAIRARGK